MGGVSLRIGFSKQIVIGILIESEDKIYAYYDNTREIKDLGKIELVNIKEFILKQYQQYLKVNCMCS